MLPLCCESSKNRDMENKEILFREKAETYLVCFNGACPRHEQCLRWQVGQRIDPRKRIVTSVSPFYAPAAEGHCDEYRDARPIRMPLGMKNHFYEEMPARTAYNIKNALIAHNCRATYYKYHNGKLPITPEYEALIRQTCRRYGWTQPLVFDGEVVDYVW